MQRISLIGVMTALIITTCGCLTQQLANDGHGFREALQDMYVNQSLDNLIQAHDSQPFIQLAYRNLIITDTRKAKANAGDEYDPSITKSFVVATGALLSRTQQFANQVLFGASVENDRQMQFTADPVVGNSQIYDYYRAFAQDPELFSVCDKEPKFPVYLKKKSCGRWYYVPCDSGPVFQQLVLKTSLMLGQESPPPVFRTTRILHMSPQTKIGENYVTDIVFFDPVPDDPMAYMVIQTAECPNLERVVPLKTKPHVIPVAGFVTSVRVSQLVPLPELEGVNVKVYSPERPDMGTESWEALRLKASLDAYRKMRAMIH